MKKMVLLVALLAAIPATAQAAGSLEYDYGHGGKAITPLPLGSHWSQTAVHLDEAPDGGVVLGGSDTLTRYLPDGELDLGFGRDGLLPIALPGVARFEIGDVAVDSAGRFVVVGTATRVGSRGGISSLATALRYLPDGEPDLSFGERRRRDEELRPPPLSGAGKPCQGALRSDRRGEPDHAGCRD